MICHDHDLFPTDLESMRRGGVAAKQVHICVDGLIWADRETLLASATLEEEYLKRSLIAMDYIILAGGALRGPDHDSVGTRRYREGQTGRPHHLLLGAEGTRLLLENRLEVLRLYRLAWAAPPPTFMGVGNDCGGFAK